MNRWIPIAVVLLLVGCAGLVPQTPREALAVTEVTFQETMTELIVLRTSGQINDQTWTVVKTTATDIHAALKLARAAIASDVPADQHIRVMQEGIRLLRLRIMEAEK